MSAENISIKWNIEKPGGQPRRCLDIQKSKKEIGFMPIVSMEEGLKRTIDWYEGKQ